MATISSPSSTSSDMSHSKASSPASLSETATAKTRVFRDLLYPSLFAYSECQTTTLNVMGKPLCPIYDLPSSTHLACIGKQRLWPSFKRLESDFSPVPASIGTVLRTGPWKPDPA